MVETKIVNVVATASLCQKLELVKLCEFRVFSYNPYVYGGKVAYFKTEKMKGLVSIFSSGKLISVGTKSEHDAFFELAGTEKFLVKKGIIKSVKLEPKIQNLVVTVNLKKSLNLEKLAEAPKVIYEPEQFPGLILHLEEPIKASVLIFASGKMVVAGLRSSAQIEPIIQQMYDFINSAGS